MFYQILSNVKKQNPLVHNITNYVTVNDCANILLACGASPIMADDLEEVEEITKICNGLNINLGTLNHNTIKAMLRAGKKAIELGHPVILDPVGVGASTLRTNTALELMKEIPFAVIRGNISEMKTLALGTNSTKGVDADVDDYVTEENLESSIAFAKEFAKRTKAVIAITGEIDIVANEDKAFCIRNGHPMMSKITGTGCQLSAMMAAYISANPKDIFTATAASVCAMGVCGEIAFGRMDSMDGNATYRNYIIDAVYNLSADDLERGAKYEMY